MSLPVFRNDDGNVSQALKIGSGTHRWLQTRNPLRL